MCCDEAVCRVDGLERKVLVPRGWFVRLRWCGWFHLGRAAGQLSVTVRASPCATYNLIQKWVSVCTAAKTKHGRASQLNRLEPPSSISMACTEHHCKCCLQSSVNSACKCIRTICSLCVLHKNTMGLYMVCMPPVADSAQTAHWQDHTIALLQERRSTLAQTGHKQPKPRLCRPVAQALQSKLCAGTNETALHHTSVNTPEAVSAAVTQSLVNTTSQAPCLPCNSSHCSCNRVYTHY
jgi:hypothetical protein